jgi:hypothetical protein
MKRQSQLEWELYISYYDRIVAAEMLGSARSIGEKGTSGEAELHRYGVMSQRV